MLLLMGMAATAMAQPHQDDLALWLRAGKGVYVEEGRVAQWEDQSGRGNHATSSDGSGPTVRADAINGMPTVVFDGAKTRMTIEHAPELNAGEGFTVFCVFRYADGFRVAQKKSNSGGIVADGWFLSPAEGLGVSGKWGGGRSYRQNRWHVQTSLFDSVSGAIRIFSDGSEIKVTEGVAAQVPNDDPVYLGQRLNPGGTEGHLRGEIAELMICSAALTDEERRQTEEYLSVKYDLTPPVKPTMYITRVIPGHGTVDVEWLPHEGDVAGYIFEIKLRELAWEQADRAELPAEARSFSVAGLWDYADYTLRVLPVDATGEPIGQSAERIVAPGPVPGVVVDYLHREDEAFAEHGQYIGSPSITRLDDGRLIASHDLFGPGPQRFSRVFRSEDDGESWAWISDVAPAFWGKLFVHRGELYLLSTATEYGDLLLHHSPDGGDSWEPRIVIVSGTYHKAPMPIIEHQGKLWTCVELQTGGWPAGFQAVACSVPVDADLTDPASWALSAPLAYEAAWLPEGWDLPVKIQGYLEGNAVVTPGGDLVNILRYNTTPHYGKAMVLNIAPDGTGLSYNRVIDFYGGMTKFAIRKHPETGIYWSLVNRVTTGQAGQRSVLTLVWSRDLDEWHIVRDILRDDRNSAVKYTGFQYVDWLFDGDDIIVASRTALNGANNFHDANHLTFHRVSNFADGGP